MQSQSKQMKDIFLKGSLYFPVIIAEIMLYGEDGMNIMINRGWLEQPPLAFDRKAFV